MSRYDTNTEGRSPALSEVLDLWRKMPRSSFDLSRRKSFDIEPYAIVPFECGLLYPNSDLTLTYDLSVITKNPTIKRMLSGMSAEISVYKCKPSDCWKGWNNLVTRGRSGKLDLEIPHLDWNLNHATGTYTTSLPYNPAHYLNIAPAVFWSNDATNKWDFDKNTGVKFQNLIQQTGLTGNIAIGNLKDVSALKVSALPFVMYTKIVKKFMNSNLMQNNKNWYPEDEDDDTILPRTMSGQAVSAAIFSDPQKPWVNGTSTTDLVADSAKSAPWLNVLYYKMKRGDYFNTGSPFPDLLRGDVPTLNVFGASVDFTNSVDLNFASYTPYFVGLIDSASSSDIFSLIGGHSSFKGIDPSESNSPSIHSVPGETSRLLNTLNQNTVKGLSFNMNMWRKLAVETSIRERLARTDGSYNQMVQSLYGHNPHVHTREAQYVGGSTQQIVFSEVVQTGGDTASSPLGSSAGRAVSAQVNKPIHIHSDDFEMYMAVLTLTPDMYYSQGVDRQWSGLSNEDLYIPVRNNLPPQATLNKELYVSGDNSVDEDVFNYQERYAHLKSRQNQISGLLSLAINKVGDIGAYVFNNLFGSTPQFNQEFVKGKLSDNEHLAFASTTQAQFVASIVSRAHMTGPIPAVARPADLGISF